jgi:hypothetical protein
MWIYAVGAIAGVTFAAMGRVMWKSLRGDEEQRIQGTTSQLLIDAEVRRTEEMAHVDDEASDICKARVRRRMKLGHECKEAPLIGKRRFQLVETQRAG